MRELSEEDRVAERNSKMKNSPSSRNQRKNKLFFADPLLYSMVLLSLSLPWAKKTVLLACHGPLLIPVARRRHSHWYYDWERNICLSWGSLRKLS